MRLTTEQLKKMNAYVGCGPHMDADIIVMGNEEGTGGYPEEIEAHCTARFRLYGKDEQTVDALLKMAESNLQALHDDNLHQEETYTYSLNGNWRNGFWEENDKDGENKIERYMIARDGALKTKVDVPHSDFLRYLSRICLALNNRNEDKPLHYWFQTMNEERSAIINGYTRSQLFKKSADGIKTALTDWRPLPRPNQGRWPEQYHLLGDSDAHYINAFEFDENEKGSDVYALAERRAELLGDLIANSKARFLIMIGEVDTKIKLVQRFFPNREIQFHSLPTRNQGYTTTINLPDKDMHIYIMPFFGNGAMSLDELHQFVRTIFLPDYTSQPRLEWVNEKPEPDVRKRRVAKTGTFHSERLKAVADAIRREAPDIMSHGRDYDTGKGFYYIHFWLNGEPWKVNDFSAHLHDRKTMLDVRLGVYYDRYSGEERARLSELADRLEPYSKTNHYKYSRNAQRLIISKRFETSSMPTEEQAAGELIRLLRQVKQMYEEIAFTFAQ